MVKKAGPERIGFLFVASFSFRVPIHTKYGRCERRDEEVLRVGRKKKISKEEILRQMMKLASRPVNDVVRLAFFPKSSWRKLRNWT